MKGHSIIISRYESIALSNLESRSCSKCTCVTVSNEVSTCTLSVACRVEQGRLEGVRERGLEFKKNEKVVKREKTEISVVNGTQFSLKKVIINFGGWKSEIKIFQGMWKIYRKKAWHWPASALYAHGVEVQTKKWGTLLWGGNAVMRSVRQNLVGISLCCALFQNYCMHIAQKYNEIFITN